MSIQYYNSNTDTEYIPGRYVNKVIYLLLILFLGAWGIQYFFAGKNTKGILSILFFWTFIPTIIAFI
jgi:membrane protein